ncbi:MAG: helix-turn-helix domain-containing protein, partial [Candidatus Hadarchaeum sp.]|uniref:helix-turn-helix domain-containing protein n=1 Tax=Candidatus Hadarchaeum sp. TaxID=2883567 RepID=UPI003D0E27D9
MDLAYKEAYAMNREAARMRLVETYLQTGSIAETARRWHTSRNLVRKWVQRYQESGAGGLADRSRRPRRSPTQTPAQIEAAVLEAKERTGYGRKRLAWYLWREKGLALSPHTIRHILSRNGFGGRKKKRKTFYPAHWAWEEERPFTLAQVDVKDVLDKGALGTKPWDHLAKRKLPRYQWTFLEGRTRLRFLAWSHEVSLTNGLCFMSLVMLWLRGHGIEGEVVWQTDWGEEFGERRRAPTRLGLFWGSNPDKLHRLQKKHYEPVGARLARIPLGRKEHNGRVERSHRTDDEEFYIPFLDKVRTEEGLLRKAAGWVYYYNLERPTTGRGWTGNPRFGSCGSWGTIYLRSSPCSRPWSWIGSAPTGPSG